MKLIVASVLFDDKLETPESKLDVGEFITTRVVELAKLYDELKGMIVFS
jgi:ADP-ribose pyrophosphatase